MATREEDIETVCNHIIIMNIQDTGDSGTGGQCPFCYKECYYAANDVSEINHEPDCIYLIAKDLLTKQ